MGYRERNDEEIEEKKSDGRNRDGDQGGKGETKEQASEWRTLAAK